MFVELIEALRCPRDHEESPLVVTALRTEARHIMEGMLGCPVCRAEFPIRNGEALFASGAGAEPIPPNLDIGMRLAAGLDLTEARGFGILCGSWGAHAPEIRQMTGTQLLLVNPPRGVDVIATGVVRVHGRIPVAPRSARAAALDDGGDALLTASTISAVRPRGRVIGPVDLPLPDGVEELARDAQMWVGERSAAPDDPTRPLVKLARG